MFSVATKCSIGSNPIEFVNGFTGSSLSSGVTSVTFSGHEIGDLLIATGSGQRTTDPTFTAGWTKIISYYSPSSVQRVGIIVYKFATTASNETLTFTSSGSSSAAYSAGHIYRNVYGIGNSSARTNISGDGDTTIPIPDLTLQKINSSSWVYASNYLPVLTSATDMTSNNGQLYLKNLTSNFTTRIANTDGTLATNISGIVELLN